MASYTGQGTILGGLPVIADVSWGTNYWGEGYADVDAIYWMKRDGSKGKAIPQHLFDRAEKYDPYFSRLTEQLSDQAAYEARDPADDEMVLLDA